MASRQPAEGWIHNSDRGVQYACRDYVTRVGAARGRVSMAAKGSPRENAQAESFIRTLKHEEVYLVEYQTFREAERGIGDFIKEVYDRKRLHSALRYRPACEFEELCAAGVLHEMCVRPEGFTSPCTQAVLLATNAERPVLCAQGEHACSGPKRHHPRRGPRGNGSTVSEREAQAE